MEVNTFFLRFAILLMTIFGGTFIFRFILKDELLLDQLLGLIVGFIILLSSLIWRKINQHKQTS